MSFASNDLPLDSRLPIIMNKPVGENIMMMMMMILDDKRKRHKE